MANLEEKVTFDTAELEDLVVKIEHMPGMLDEEIQAAAAAAVVTARRAIGQYYGKNLAKRWRVEANTQGTQTTIRAWSDDPIVGYYEFGTRPHIIRARNAHALRFMMDGQLVFAKYVHHPGTQAHNKLDRLRVSFNNSVYRSWKTAVDNAVSKAF